MSGRKQRKNIPDNISEQKRSQLRDQSSPNLYNSGFYNQNIVEPNPIYNSTPIEKVFQGNNNTFIILGRDRPRGKSSGYGGNGHTHAGCIDIVAGMTGIMCREEEDGIAVVTDKSPELDAARIYISQKTNIDDNFSLFARQTQKRIKFYKKNKYEIDYYDKENNFIKSSKECVKQSKELQFLD